MINPTLFIFIFFGVPLVHPSPVPSRDKEIDNRVLYDQRQEGEWNVRADLKNFVILIIPTHTSPSSTPGTPALLDFLSKTIPKRKHLNKNKPNKHPTVQETTNQETFHFIESKTAPYHVDISKSKEQLEKLHPENLNEEILVANSPTVSLVNPKNKRISRALVLTIPAEEEYVVSKTEDHKKVVKKDGKKKIYKEQTKPPMKLLGAENEQCGPGLERDSQGICKLIKDN